MFSYFVYGPQCLLYFIFDTFDIPISCIYTDIPLYSFILLHRLDFHVSLAFNASVFTLFYLHCISHFCPYGWNYFICLCIPMYVYIIHPFYLCYRSNWLQKREWYRACDCIGSLSLPLGVYRRFLGFFP